MRFSSDTFQQFELHVHDVLADVPLKDVWVIELRGGGDERTIADVLALVSVNDPRKVNVAVRFLFGLRGVLGNLFGWDKTDDTIPDSSFVHQLPPDVADKSLETPGSINGPVRVMYRLPYESLGEIINATIHAFISFSMQPTATGYRAFLAAYAIETKWWSKYYMWLIEPFRRWIVYPGLVRSVSRRWAETYAATADPSATPTT